MLQGKSWVDIGCGNGAFTAQIIEKCAPCKVEGIDPSDAQVEGAKKLSWKVPVNFQTGDAMALPYDSDSFDIGKLIKPVFFLASNFIYHLHAFVDRLGFLTVVSKSVSMISD